MNLIDKQLTKIKSENRLGLMAHVVLGYPSLKITELLVKIMVDEGVDFIELQIPFSDPLADGPTIMNSCEESLQKGTKVRDAFVLASKLSKQAKVPLLFMAYYNTVFKYGTKKFCDDARGVGIAGLVVPDIPPEEEHREHFIRYCKQANLKNIRVVSPVSSMDRLKKNAKVASGFIYCTARVGITGSQKALDPNITSFLKIVRRYFSIPIAVGFGLSNRGRISLVEPYTDIVVVGSALIDVINKSAKNVLEKEVKDFLNGLGIKKI